jgi:predicted MFS family arabinose efflux permease
MSGMAFYVQSYTFLLISRALSGVGEASFQCSVPPWIQYHADEGTRATWISIFYTAIPVGTAMGYVYSSFMSDSLGWQWAFFFEAVFMFPFVLFLFYVSPAYPRLELGGGKQNKRKTESRSYSAKQSPLHDNTGDSTQTSSGLLQSATLNESLLSDDDSSVNSDNHEPPSICEELSAIFSRPVYLCIVFGYAAQTGSLIGISTFGSSFLMGLGFFNTETEASSCFGVLVSVSGIIGNLSGGILLDRNIAIAKAKRQQELDNREVGLHDLSKDEDEDRAEELIHVKASTSLITVTSFFGCCAMWSCYLIMDKYLFMIAIGTGCALMFMATPGINIGAMNAVNMENRAFSIAMMSVMIHALGDVPSPVIAGFLKDELAPDCNGVDAASDECREDNEGLRLTMLIITFWLGWCILFFALARLIASSKRFRNDSARVDDNRLRFSADDQFVNNMSSNRVSDDKPLLNSTPGSSSSSTASSKGKGKKKLISETFTL